MTGAAAKSRTASAVLAAVPIVFGAVALLGWALDLPLVRSLHPDWLPMKPNTALALAAAGAALLLERAHDRRLRSLARALAAGVAAVGAITLGETATGTDALWFDNILLLHPLEAIEQVHPGRMGPNTAAGLVLAGAALLLLDRQARAGAPAEWLALATGLGALATILGYLFGARELYELPWISAMAMPTALSFASLAAAIVLARPDRGLAGLLLGDGVGSVAARRLLPWVATAPVALAWVGLRANQAGFVDAALGNAALAAVLMAVLGTIVAASCHHLRRLDRERAAAAAAARSGEERLRTTLDSIGDAVVTTDARARVASMNPVAERLTGWSAAEARERSIEDVFRVHDRQTGAPLECPVARALRDGAVTTLEAGAVLLGRDGVARPVADTCAPIRDASGAVQGAVLVFRDVTEERRSQDALHLLAECSRLLGTRGWDETLHAIARVMVSGPADWCIVDVLAGSRLERQVVLHRDPARAAAADEYRRDCAAAAGRSEIVFRTLRTGEPCLMAEWSAATEGRARELLALMGAASMLSVPLPGRSGVLGALTLVRGPQRPPFSEADIELAAEVGRRAALAVDTARLYAEARQAVQDREDLMAVVSHDLKAPLSVVALNTAQLVRMAAPDHVERARRKAALVDRSVDRMARLITDLLELVRIENGHLKLQPEELEAAALVDEVRQAFEDLANDKSVSLSGRAAPGLRVRCDRERMMQALSNLVSNALKFTEAGFVEVGAAQVGDEVVFHVRDSGGGIDPEELPNLFDRYWQAREAGKRGAGLGLSIARGIAEAHGGRIWAESVAGKGSTLRLALPAARASAECARQPAA